MSMSGAPKFQTLFGFERVTGLERESHVVSVSPSGTLLWQLPVKKGLGASEGAYLYAQSWSQASSQLAVATDDGNVGLFSFSQK